MKLSEEARRRVERQLDFLNRAGGRLVIDADTHLSDPRALPPAMAARVAAGPDYFHGRPLSLEELLAEMRCSAVDMALSWQNPSCTPYTDSAQDNFRALRAANEYIRRAAEAQPERIIPAGWTDPKALGLEGALRMVDACVLELGFPVVKLNPAQNAYPIDSPEAAEVTGRIVELGAVPAFHYGADTPYTPPEGLEAVARRHPDHPVIGVHMGGGGASYNEAEDQYTATRAMGLRNPNVLFVMSAKRDTHIESDLIAYALAGEPFSGNLACGSDAPYGRQSWNFGGYERMFATLRRGDCHPDPRVRANPERFTPELFQGFLGGNLARRIVEAYRRLLGQR